MKTTYVNMGGGVKPYSNIKYEESLATVRLYSG